MDSEKQKDEISVLQSIYNSEEFSYHNETDRYQCTFTIFINLPKEYHITYEDRRQPNEPKQKIKVSHLPPLRLHAVLPENYPSELPPEFTLYSSWLSLTMLTKLCTKLDKLWEENSGQEILFTWVAFLQDESLEFLGIQNNLNMSHTYMAYKDVLKKAHNVQKTSNMNKECTIQDEKNKTKVEISPKCLYNKRCLQKYLDKRGVLDWPIGKNPIQVLIDYNEERNQIEFKRNFYSCKVCFMDKIGEHCVQFLPCGHVFCKDCMNGYLEVRIKEGNVQNITCPEGKCTSEATPAQIKDIVSSELFAKYDSVLLSATLATMGDIVYCPRRSCQYPVSCEPNEQMANCPICQYVFCIRCKSVYHGIEPCKFMSNISRDAKQKLITDYQEASNDKKLEMEQCYGKKQLQHLIENTMSEDWIEMHSNKCPRCQFAIEKVFGCNKMVCWRCDTFFCWLCKSILDRNDPYSHYKNSKSKCFNKLFHGMLIRDDDEDEEDMNFDWFDDDDDDDHIYI